MSQRLIYLNGELVPQEGPHLSALDRGFTLADGVFDTLRATGETLYRVEDHLVRLEQSAAAIGLRPPLDRDGLRAAIVSTLDANQMADALVRVTISRGVPAERGLLPPASPACTVAIVPTPFAGYPEQLYERGYRAIVSSIRRNETSPLSRVKSCCYLDSILARMEASERGADDALLRNTAGDIACTSSGNLFIVLRGRLVTPSLATGILAGVTRRVVLELAAREGIPTLERFVAPEEVGMATELFETNTALGVMPVVMVDGRAVGEGAPGPITLQLRAAYQATLTGVASP